METKQKDNDKSSKGSKQEEVTETDMEADEGLKVGRTV